MGRTFQDDHVVDDLFSQEANNRDQKGPKKKDLHRGCVYLFTSTKSLL